VPLFCVERKTCFASSVPLFPESRAGLEPEDPLPIGFRDQRIGGLPAVRAHDFGRISLAEFAL
jgi:hypothetical protein